ncbi:MAG: cupin domain-containing protein [Anaerolineales bacterium]|nr:cupin domain-containing protein [Anaerolineales bacterium]
MADVVSVGVKVRELRKERHLSQRDLACQAGLSPNAISLIERDEISPSVATLQRLAVALQIKMSYFFEEDEDDLTVIHVKASDRPALTSKGLLIAALGRRLHNQEMEPFFVSLAPEAESGRHPVIHSGHEFVCCLNGTVEYEIDGTVYKLQAGDFLLFEAELPHHWRNPSSAEQAELLLILQSSHGSNEPIRRHFSSHPSVLHIGSWTQGSLPDQETAPVRSSPD